MGADLLRTLWSNENWKGRLTITWVKTGQHVHMMLDYADKSPEIPGYDIVVIDIDFLGIDNSTALVSRVKEHFPRINVVLYGQHQPALHRVFTDLL